MIVRNEVHVVAEVLDVVAPYISSWVIVDTGSDDGTQDLIRDHMARLGIPGELYERPWRNFGHNRTEALALAQGRADYILIMDADDTFVGTPDFTRLDADVYLMRYFGHGDVFWVPQLFRDGMRVHWKGVTHEYAVWEDSCVVARLEGDYNIGDRHLSTRNISGEKYVRDRDLLLAELERNPEDARSAFYLAQSYFCLGDLVNARKWYARRVEMGGWAEEVGYSMYKMAMTMEQLDEPWPDVQDAYLRAWAFRPVRAEPLHAIARRYRANQRYRLGYLFAKNAAEIPFPEREALFVRPDIYAWRILDEQAVCASWIDKHAEAFALSRRLLARPELPDDDRARITRNRDLCAPTMIDAASGDPDAALLKSLQHVAARDPEVVVSLIAGPDRATTELTLNSFLRCCTDVSRVGRFLVIDAGLSAQDRALLREHYRFLEFAQTDTRLDQIRTQVDGRFWLHLGQGWQFFAPENLITRLTSVLEAEQQVFQVGINFTDAVKLTGATATEDAVRRTPDAGRYVLTDVPACGPAMFDTARLDRFGGMQGTDPESIARLGRHRAAAAGLGTASLDEVLCIKQPSVATAIPPPAGRLARAVEYKDALDTVAGSFYPMDVLLFEFILSCQLRDGIPGDVLEIGAYEGKSAILLGYGLRDEDHLVVCDLFGLDPTDFEVPAEGMRDSTGLTLDRFYQNYDRFHARRPQVEVCPSWQLGERFGGRRFRFIHIDGGHAYDCVKTDIRTAIDHAAEDAVIVLDDYSSPHTPGVAAAVWEATLGGLLYPFGITAAKLYATASPEAQARWRKTLLEFNPADVSWQPEVHEVAGSEVLRFSYW